MTAVEPLKRILIPVDFSDASIKAMAYGLRIAAGASATVHLLYVADDPVLVPITTDQAFRDKHAAEVKAKFEEMLTAEQRDQFDIVIEVRCGTAYQEIETYSLENQMEMIVMGSTGRSALSDVLVGSVTKHVLRHAPCPVVSVRHN